MTIKQFAAKYQIPYYMAYKASYKAQPVDYSLSERDYSEEDLLRETRKLVKRRLTEIRGQYEMYAEAAGRLRKTTETEGTK